MDSMYGFRKNEQGQAVRTKWTHPYNYDPFVIWKRGGQATGSVYSDRLFQWDPAKYNELCGKHFGNEEQYWDRREPAKIEAWLRDYNERPDLHLVCITEYCNQATGYPVWRFDYYFTPEVNVDAQDVGETT